MLASAFHLFCLRELPFSRFDFPRWQAILAVSLLGVLIGLDPGLRAASSGMSTIPVWLAVLLGILTTWVVLLVIVAVLRWWMRRGGRWDGQGSLFNLVVVSWLVADTLGAGLTALGVPPLLTAPLWLYSIWVGGNALSGAMPKASLAYSIGGIVMALVPAMLVSGLLFGGGAVVMAMSGLMPLPAGA